MLAGPVVAGAIAAGAALSAGWILVWQRRRQRRRDSWTPVGRVSEIHTYPLKSCAGQSHSSAFVTSVGLRNPAGAVDRCLAIVCDGEVISGKHRRRLVLIHAEVNREQVILSAEGYPQLAAPLPKSNDDLKLVNVLFNDSRAEGIQLGNEISNWLNNFFNDGKLYTMIYFMAEVIAPRKSIELPRLYTYLASDKDKMLYNFVGPVSMLSTSSLKALNARLSKPLTADSFRHNFIIDGTSPFDEDSWLMVRIGGAVMRYIKPVHRCVITTVDPVTATLSKTMEPLKTLRKFRGAKTAEEKRLYGESPLFGSCFGVEVEGEVAVGDTVYAMQK